MARARKQVPQLLKHAAREAAGIPQAAHLPRKGSAKRRRYEVALRDATKRRELEYQKARRARREAAREVSAAGGRALLDYETKLQRVYGDRFENIAETFRALPLFYRRDVLAETNALNEEYVANDGQALGRPLNYLYSYH
jgi:hypothetical protein